MILDVPIGDARYGKFQRCPNNPVEADTAMQERLRRYGNLSAYRDYRFDNFHINIAGGYSDAAKASLKQAKTAAQAFAEEPEGWLVFEGPYGCGKTHLAVAIANQRLESAGEQVMFITAPDLLDLLRMTMGGESDASFDAYFERIRNIPLLALDDLGVENPSDWAREKLFQLLNHRHVSGLPTVITTNAPVEALDPRVSSRIQQRSLVQRVRIDAPDYRGQTGAQSEEPSFSSLRLYDHMRFDTFDTDSVYRDERENLQGALNLARDWAANPVGWLCFIGDYGSGKSHLAAAIAYDLYERGKDVIFTGVPDLLDYFRVSFDGRSREGSMNASTRRRSREGFCKLRRHRQGAHSDSRRLEPRRRHALGERKALPDHRSAISRAHAHRADLVSHDRRNRPSLDDATYGRPRLRHIRPHRPQFCQTPASSRAQNRETPLMLGTTFAVTAYERRHRSALLDLVAASHWTHLHLDWTTLGRWLDRGDGIFALAWHGDSLAGCMGLAETGPGAAWLRVLSLRDGFMAFPLVDSMWRALKLRCAQAGIHNIMALAICDWLPLCLAEQGFVALDELVTMSLSADQQPATSPAWIRVKAAEIEDLGRVAAVDAAAFPPIWRMPRLDLRDAWRGGADVKFADSKGRMVAYSLCLRELDLGHIARLAVLPRRARTRHRRGAAASGAKRFPAARHTQNQRQHPVEQSRFGAAL